MKYIITFFLIIFTSFNSYAGEGWGKVTHLLVHKSNDTNGIIMFRVETNQNKADCSKAHGGSAWAFKLATEEGRAMYSLLLTAATTNKNVSIKGTGNCSSWGDREEPFHITIAF